MNKIIYKKLKEVAKNQGTITYGQVGTLIGTDMDNISERRQMELMLGEISEFECNEGRPLLSIVVVHAQDGFPGRQFRIRFAGYGGALVRCRQRPGKGDGVLQQDRGDIREPCANLCTAV